ncbi:MAG: glycoside hydrolase [Chloroflexota bacterium]|nr:glycoside hydrolase [Chloroflexota bacterium]
METQLYLATGNGLVICTRDGAAWRAIRRTLDGRRIPSVIAREGVILAGTRDGVMRSDDHGQTWHDASAGLATRYVRWLAYHPGVSDREFAGTEPAAIFVSHDGAASWRECPEVAQLRDAYGWFLPYSSGAGCVRGFAFHGTRAYAAVEVGGALRSDDQGETWQLCEGSDGNPALGGPPEPFIYPDVHSIAVHPASPDLVFAPTGGGFYGSTDGGKTWTLLYDCYARAVWLDPADPAHLVLGPADRVDSHGRIEETRDGGATWRLASDGLQVPWRRHMVERFAQIGDELFAVLSNGQLLSTPVAKLEWKQILPDVHGVNAVAAMPA